MTKKYYFFYSYSKNIKKVLKSLPQKYTLAKNVCKAKKKLSIDKNKSKNSKK